MIEGLYYEVVTSMPSALVTAAFSARLHRLGDQTGVELVPVERPP